MFWNWFRKKKRPHKKTGVHRQKISISLSPEIIEGIEKETTNKSRLIQSLLIQFFKDNGEDTSNIKQ